MARRKEARHESLDSAGDGQLWQRLNMPHLHDGDESLAWLAEHYPDHRPTDDELASVEPAPFDYAPENSYALLSLPSPRKATVAEVLAQVKREGLRPESQRGASFKALRRKEITA